MIRVNELVYSVGSFKLGPLTIRIPEKKFFVIIGPSGAGKSIFLELLSGLRRPRKGRLFLNGTEITHLPPEEREISMVFQKSLLFPHMNVFENIAFGLRVKGLPEKKIKEKVLKTAELCGVTHLLHRTTQGLSGGEAQRVALARALAVSPRVLLLDEPLSALDRPAREELRRHLRRLQNELQITAIHVTHDFEEALSLADTLGILINGNFVQVGEPISIISHPASEQVAKLLGFENIVYGEIEGSVFRAGPLIIQVTESLHAGKGVAFFKAEHVRIVKEKNLSCRGILIRGKVLDVWGWDPHRRALVEAGEITLVVRAGTEFTVGSVKKGENVFVEILPEYVVVKSLK